MDAAIALIDVVSSLTGRGRRRALAHRLLLRLALAFVPMVLIRRCQSVTVKKSCVRTWNQILTFRAVACNRRKGEDVSRDSSLRTGTAECVDWTAVAKGINYICFSLFLSANLWQQFLTFLQWRRRKGHGHERRKAVYFS